MLLKKPTVTCSRWNFRFFFLLLHCGALLVGSVPPFGNIGMSRTQKTLAYGVDSTLED